MGRNLVGRIRWGNVALAATVLIGVVASVAWAFGSAAGPGLPPDAPRPLLAETPVPRPEMREKGEEEQRVEKQRTPRSARRGGKKSRGGSPRPRARNKARERAVPAAMPTAAPTVAPTAPPSRVAPPRKAPTRRTTPPSGEFGFEGAG